jgi:hypothetical protein
MHLISWTLRSGSEHSEHMGGEQKWVGNLRKLETRELGRQIFMSAPFTHIQVGHCN